MLPAQSLQSEGEATSLLALWSVFLPEKVIAKKLQLIDTNMKACQDLSLLKNKGEEFFPEKYFP